MGKRHLHVKQTRMLVIEVKWKTIILVECEA